MVDFVALWQWDGTAAEAETLLPCSEELGGYSGSSIELGGAGAVAFLVVSCRLPFVDGRAMDAVASDGDALVIADARLDDRGRLVATLSAHCKCDVSHAESDAHLLLRAWRVWGLGLRERVIGDYAFVIIDRRQGEVLAGRSHPGWRPLYYARVPGGVLFASAADALVRHRDVSGDLSEVGVASFLAFADASRGDEGRTALRAVRKVPSGGAVLFDANGKARELSTIWLWEYYPSPDPPNHSRLVPEQFYDLLLEATRDRLWFNTASILLSGGMDSPTAAYCAQRVLADRGAGKLVAFTVSRPDDLRMLAEEAAARLVAESLGIFCHLLDFQAYPFLRPKTYLSELMIRPSGERFHAYRYRLTAAAPICLNGTFGDALRMRNARAELKRLGVIRIIWRSLGLLTDFRLWPGFGGAQFFGNRQAPRTDSLPRWLRKETVASHGLLDEMFRSPKRDSRADPCLKEFRQLSSFADYASAYAGFRSMGVEASDPFSDARLLTFVAKLDGCPWRTHKFAMRTAMKGKLPKDILTRQKSVTSSQIADFFLSNESDWVDGFVRRAGLDEWIDYSTLPHSRAWGNSEELALLHGRTLFLGLWMKRFENKKFAREREIHTQRELKC